MITVFAILSAVTAAALLYSLRMNRELARQLAALADAQAVTESRLDKISRKTRKRPANRGLLIGSWSSSASGKTALPELKSR